MKNKKLTVAAGSMLVIAMLFSTLSVAAVDCDAATTTPTHHASTEVVSTTVIHGSEEPTNVPVEVPTTEPTTDGEYSDEYWDGYYDGYYDGVEDIENEDYDSGYDDGYDDGEYDGYWQGYYEGYYDGVNAYEEPTIFDKWDNFTYELKYRIELFFARIRDFFERIFKTGDYTPVEPIDPDNSDFIPDGSQATLEGNTETQTLCDEFNALVETAREVKEPVTITKKVDVGITVGDVPAIAANIVNDIIESFLVNDSTTNYYVAGDYAYTVQSTELYPEGLAEATKTVNADGTTDYKFVVIEEAAYYNGNYTTGVKFVDGEITETNLQHDYVADTLYIEYADLDPVTIKTAEIVYPGATITAKTDAKGRLIAYDINMPVKGEGTAKISAITLTASLEGYRNEGFVMEYDA
ncbi:MAG: hypothetical protein IJW86_06500 [Clostridia bacterium]|nr:hypothetical protein [Clostridia bacterium]